MKDKRVQSALGREKTEYFSDTDVSDLIVCKVVKVNYLYNTVDVIAKDRNDSYIKPTETLGRYSARLPVNFGGALSNGASYGQTIPINIGDEVVIGFIRGMINSPIVIGIYKSEPVSKDLVPNPNDLSYISGDPENPENFDLLMTHGTVYPSQVYSFVSGTGNIEKTIAGKVFLKSSTDTEAQSAINDYLFTYEDLDNAFQRNGDVREPVNPMVPSILFQAPWRGISAGRTNFYLDDGLVRFSNLDIGNKKNTFFFMNRNGDIGFNHQIKDPDPDAGTYEEIESDVERTVMGIVNGNPVIKTPKASLTFKDKDLLVNDKTLQSMIEGYTLELEKVVERLTADINDIVDIVSEIDLEALKTLQNNVDKLLEDVDSMGDQVSSLSTSITLLQNNFNDFVTAFNVWKEQTDAGVNALNQEIVDARGMSPSLKERLFLSDTKVDELNTAVQEMEERSFIIKESSTSTDTLLKADITAQGEIVNIILEGTAMENSTIELQPFALSPLPNGLSQTVRLLNVDTQTYTIGFVEITGNTLQVFGMEATYPIQGYKIASTVTYARG